MNVEAIAIGAGPSFLPWLKKGKIPEVPIFACSWIPWRMKVNVYAYADLTHAADVPKDGARIVASDRAWTDGMELFDTSYPHAGQSGGMAISTACRAHNIIGLVGFDGGLPAAAESELRALLEWWVARGKRLVSLMPKSSFDDLMEKP